MYCTSVYLKGSNMETVLSILLWAFKISMTISVIAGAWLVIYIYWWSDKTEYKKAKKEIFEYVKARKSRCSGANRFVVTVPVLQEVFPEFETKIIDKVWQDLVSDRVIQQDPQDQEWCLR